MGGNDSDKLYGGSGNDVINGGSGDDGLFGGAGDDSFVFEANSGDDIIYGFKAGAGSDDVLDLSAYSYTDISSLLANTGQSGHTTVINLDADNSISLVGVSVSDLHEDDFIFAA